MIEINMSGMSYFKRSNIGWKVALGFPASYSSRLAHDIKYTSKYGSFQKHTPSGDHFKWGYDVRLTKSCMCFSFCMKFQVGIIARGL